MSRLPASLLLASALIAGCGPQTAYVRPDLPVPVVWPEAATDSAIVAARPAASFGWREFFADPPLQTLIATALENNRDLRLAAARVEEARAQYGLAEADRWPAINLVGSRTSSLVSGSLLSSKSQDSQRNDLNLSLLSFELDFWGRLASLSDAARANYLATEEGQRSARLSLITEVANAYFGLMEVEELRRVTQATVASWEQSVEVVNSGREHGAASKLEVLQVESMLASARTRLATLDRQRSNIMSTLTYLLGANHNVIPDEQALRLLHLNIDIAPGIPAETLMRRPDIIAAEQRLIAAHANIDAARAAFFPRILLTAALGLASPALSSLFNTASQTWNYQPSISFPLFDGGRTAGNRDLAEARRNVAVADYERTIQMAFREVSDLLAARTTYAAQRQANEALVTASKERLQAVRARYRGGATTLLDVLDATRTFHETQQSLAQVQRAQLSAATQLFKALGGGD